MQVQTLVSEAPVERLNVGIISRFARSGEVERYSILVGPVIKRFADELASIVYLNAVRYLSGASTGSCLTMKKFRCTPPTFWRAT